MEKKLARARNSSSAGIIGIGKDGIPVYSFKTQQMAWAWARDGKLHNGVNPGEDLRYSIDLNSDTPLSRVIHILKYFNQTNYQFNNFPSLSCYTSYCQVF